MAMRPTAVLVTCEHGGKEVPDEYRALFRGRSALLRSHRGWDPGALDLASQLATALQAPLVASTVTRLLVDLNCSPHNPRVFSEVTKPLRRTERLALLERWHRPHWDAVRSALGAALRAHGCALHLGIHSFTPVLDGVRRRADVAVLYDPSRPVERELAVAWARALTREIPARVVRRNDPYRGNTDGLATAMRRELSPSRYVGIEIAVNQRHVDPSGRFSEWVADALLHTLAEVFA
ncbi:MAG: N-formylglutamate amidohydrolase [Gemmatimonadetes bacterium]|nr:N-formylglutamate amidohydrolase [Gemmatimonadota bacterium]